MIFDDLAAILDLCEYLPYSINDFARFSLTAYILSVLQKNTTKVSVAIFSRSNRILLLLIGRGPFEPELHKLTSNHLICQHNYFISMFKKDMRISDSSTSTNSLMYAFWP